MSRSGRGRCKKPLARRLSEQGSAANLVGVMIRIGALK